MDLDRAKQEEHRREERDMKKALEQIADFRRRRWAIVYRYQQAKRLTDLKGQST